MESHLTLEAVQAEFQLWRQNRASRGARTPEALRLKALALLDRYSVNEIRIALGITRDMLKAWGDQSGPTSVDTATPIQFIDLPNESSAFQSVTDPLTLDVTQANGCHWCLQGNPSASQLTAFVQALSGRPS